MSIAVYVRVERSLGKKNNLFKKTAVIKKETWKHNHKIHNNIVTHKTTSNNTRSYKVQIFTESKTPRNPTS